MSIIKSFFIGGYECADLINNRGERVDILKETAHDIRILEDYTMLKNAGIETVREGIRWSFVEKDPYVYNFSEVINRITAAQETGIQQCWDICHFGYPDGLMPSHPHFSHRLTALCTAFVELYRSLCNDPLIITPINEISFLSWLGGDVRGTVPFAKDSGFDVKYFLCKAAIQAIKAIKMVEPAAQILLVEPLMKVHPRSNEYRIKEIDSLNEIQYQAMDMITGKLCPELGGQSDYMDIAGFNYYYANQWEHCGGIIDWKEEKEKRNFPSLLKSAADRYNKPVIITETGHFKEDRGLWMDQITEECIQSLENGVDLRGICIYPVLDRPDWDHLEYIACGIWGYDTVSKDRFVEHDYLEIVRSCIQKIESYRLQPLSDRYQIPVAV